MTHGTPQGSTHYARQQLAQRFAAQISDAKSASSSGLFLAAPRRIGKSTFLREDLRPALQSAGAIVLYADLWEDKRKDPGEIIASAIQAELHKHLGLVRRLAQMSGVKAITVAGVSINVGAAAASSLSLSAALAALSDETRQLIVLIIDEAQHALTTANGSNTLFALKAARDEVNSSQHFGLRVVATGSNRDKLAMLRTGKEQAFFGAPIVNFPLLDEAYIHWFFSQFSMPEGLTEADVWRLFQQAGHRPEILRAATDQILYDFDVTPSNAAERFTLAVQEQILETQSALRAVFDNLTPLQRAVLRVMVSEGVAFAPFEARTVRLYQEKLGAASEVSTDLPNIQYALAALQEKALVWKAERGVYALEDPAIADLLQS
jgi:hypothetical protein